MRNPYFRFKQFTIRHDKCAMKVGTDGVLLGAWAQIDDTAAAASTCRILDIGTGSGLIALMLAQRYKNAIIEGIDIDKASVKQAIENATEADMGNRVTISMRDFSAPHPDTEATTTPGTKTATDTMMAYKYDLIVSNPPFFVEETLGGNTARDNARHCSSLPFGTLVANASNMLKTNGRLAVIVPHSSATTFICLCAEHNLYLVRRTNIRATEKKDFNRVLLEFSRKIAATETDTLTLYDDKNNRSDEYDKLTCEFYL